MEVRLENKQAFIDALDSYQPSEHAVEALRAMPFVVLLGPTGGGRNTIINHLVGTGHYHFVVSDTTRPPKMRDGAMEVDGVNYHFRSEVDVLTDIQAGEFLEAELIHDQQVSGTSVRELVRANESGKTPIAEIDLGGTENVASIKPDTTFVFVVPPSYEVWMQRLCQREKMSSVELENRLRTAVRIFRSVLANDRFVFVVNDNLDEVASAIDDYVHGREHKLHNQRARAIAEQILAETLIAHPEVREQSRC